MTSILTHLLEGQNLNEFSKFAKDGDVRHLGTIGFNMTLAQGFERSALRREIAEMFDNERKAVRDEAERQELSLMHAEGYREMRERDQAEAERLTMLRYASRQERIRALPDSDDAVDDFISTL